MKVTNKLFRDILVLVLIISPLALYLLLSVRMDSSIKAYRSSLVALVQGNSEKLSRALWSGDLVYARQTVEFIESYIYVSHIYLLDESGNLLAGEKFDVSLDDEDILELEIVGIGPQAGRPFGVLYVKMDFSSVREDVLRQGLFNFATIVITFLLIFALVYFYLHRLLLSPMQKLQTSLSSMSSVMTPLIEIRPNEVEEIRKLKEVINQMVRDIREGQEMIVKQQVQLVQNSKMSALGEMAAGIAHEINNPLTILITRIQKIQKTLSTSDHDQSLN